MQIANIFENTETRKTSEFHISIATGLFHSFYKKCMYNIYVIGNSGLTITYYGFLHMNIGALRNGVSDASFNWQLYISTRQCLWCSSSKIDNQESVGQNGKIFSIFRISYLG